MGEGCVTTLWGYCGWLLILLLQEEDFNVHIAGLPLEHATTAAGAPATGMATASVPQNGKKGAAAAAAAVAAANERTDKVNLSGCGWAWTLHQQG